MFPSILLDVCSDEQHLWMCFGKERCQNTEDLALALSKPPAMFMSHHYVKASEAE